MHCKQIAKQTDGETVDVELVGLVCNRAEICRRKGICVLSPYSHSGLLKDGKASAAEEKMNTDDPYPAYYEILRFKKSLGFQWVRQKDFEEAVRSTGKRSNGEDHPKLIRRVEFFKLPD
jgi:hypothetical protein